MDNRLFQISARPGRLRQQDLPYVARALVSLFRKQAEVKTGTAKEISYVRIQSPSLTVQILAEDWAKILPYLQDDTLNQVVNKMQEDTVWGNQVTAHDASTIDQVDRGYYYAVLSLLQRLFTEAYPTSSV